jgi:heme/copper-type cytochrome/quinol oxidase subunit 1
MLHWSLLTGAAPDSGWFNYPPLTGIGFNPGRTSTTGSR